MTLFAGWLEEDDRAVAFQVIEPGEGPGTGAPAEGKAGLQGLFRSELSLITPLEIPKGTHLLLYFPSRSFSRPLVMGAENIDTVSLQGLGRFRSNLKVLFVQEAPLDRIPWPS
jgi:hypothetical protein